MNELRSMLEVMNDPQMRHAAMVHYPVALSGLALLAALASAIAGGRSAVLRWTAVTAYALLVVSAFLAVSSGEDAHSQLGAMSEQVHELVEEHEEMAERIWLFAAVGAVLLALSALSHRGARLGASWVAVALGIVTALWVAVTAHHGGELVYEHGVGTRSVGGDSGITTWTIAPTDDPRVSFFRSSVRPVLEQHCVRCHNPARKRPAGRLDQSSIAGMLEGGISGPAVVPGDPDGSLLITAVTWEDEDLQMPPDAPQLPPEAIEALREWIRQGAVWESVAVPGDDRHEDEHEDDD